MNLHDLVQTSQAVAGTRSRKAKVAALADGLRRLRPDEVEIGVAFLSGELPRGRIGLGYAAVRDGLDVPPAGAPSIRLTDVARTFEAIQAASGKGSAGERMRLFRDLLARATSEEQRFLAHLTIGELRQGALEGIMAEAVAIATGIDVARVRRATMLAGAAIPVAAAALREGAAGLDRFRFELFRPIQPMLAQTAEGVADALGRLDGAAFEFKMDGARIQVHRSGQDVRVYTRNLNDVTGAVPEVVEATRTLPVEAIVLDGEVIALRDDGSPHRFQTTMSRFGRKHEVDERRVRIPLSCFFFDCLHVDGADLIDRGAHERTSVLEERLPDTLRMPRIVTASEAEAESFLERALEIGHEGVMAKAVDGAYEAGSRGAAWMKIKPAHALDLVVLAAEWGSGRRQGFLSNLHLGARSNDGFVMLGKTFKGMTDELLRWQTAELLARETGRDGAVVHVRPELVVEIAFNEIQRSPHYPGGMALRFARVKRYRTDKTAAEADTVDSVRAIFARGGSSQG